MAALSELVRVTIPIPRDLMEQLSVLAWRSDLTRPQLCRRYLHIAAREGLRRYADLEGASPEDWYAAAYRCWQQDEQAALGRGEADLRTTAADLPRVSGGEG